MRTTTPSFSYVGILQISIFQLHKNITLYLKNNVHYHVFFNVMEIFKLTENINNKPFNFSYRRN